MNLSLPVVSTTIGPAWATMLNAALVYIDSHDHSSNKGKQIPTSAININANLDLNSYSPYNALSLKFASQTATLTGATNASSVYVVSGNLYFTNGAGSAIQLTSGGSIVATPSAAQTFAPISISGDLSIAPADTFVVINVDTTAAHAITLPSIGSVTAGRIFIVCDKTGNALAQNITITPDGTDKINNVAASFKIDSGNASLTLISDGTSNWAIA
jgi:hypothetical protein